MQTLNFLIVAIIGLVIIISIALIKQKFLGYELLYNLGIDSYKRRNYKNAKYFFEKAMALAPEKYEPLYNMGLTLLALNDNDNAKEKFLEVIKLNPEDADAYYNLGLIHHKKETIDEAIKYYNKVLNINQEDSYTLYSLGLAYLIKTDYKISFELFEKAISLNENNIEYRLSYAKALDEYSNKTFTKEDIEKTIEGYKNILLFDSKNEDANYGLAISYAKLGNWENTVGYCNTVIEINPKSSAAYNQLGLALYCGGDIDKAIEMYNKALGIDSEQKDYYINIAYALEKKDDLLAAIEAFEKYVNKYKNESNVTNIKEHIKELSDKLKVKADL